MDTVFSRFKPINCGVISKKCVGYRAGCYRLLKCLLW